MGKYIYKSKIKTIEEADKKKRIRFLENEKFNRFSVDVLGLGNISTRSTQVETIASIFDLSGFTKFCSQVDPHLSVPKYLSSFLEWLFDGIKETNVINSYEEGKELYNDLPFLAKFLGDGVLFLWDTEKLNETEMCNIVVELYSLCILYERDFYPNIKKMVVDPPAGLRCGIARGRVCSVGGGDDYVGPCINIASRLQKLSNLTFCFSARGFNIDNMSGEMTPRLVRKSVSLRGIGENELIYILKSEFDNLPDKEKQLFKEP